MRIQSLDLRNFRSYERFSLDNIGGLTLFVGHNGVGKTNLLEAIALMTSTQSFRHGQIAQLMREGATDARIAVRLADGNRLLDSELQLEPGKRRYFVNGKLKKIQDVQGVLPAVSFTPDDLELAKGSSSIKRDALDNLGMQLSPNYYVVHRDYEKVLRYKNRLLKDEAPQPMIESINETLITCGSQLHCYRVSLAQRLFPLVAQNYERILGEEGNAVSNEVFSGTYQPSWAHLANEDVLPSSAMAPLSRDEVREQLAEALEVYGGQEVARKRSLVGPHNDKIALYLSGRDVVLFASQGQQRSLVLAWKLAEVDLVFESLGVYPVLLLDDVMSELDATRRDMLVRFVNDEMQTFITATDLSNFNESLLSRADIHHLQ